jgi:starvation-inducible DNA-binding protein
MFALYLKMKNFHWHITGRHFRDYHLLLDEQADQLFAMTDDDRRTSTQDWREHDSFDQRYLPPSSLKDNNEEFAAPKDMLNELRADHQHLTRALRAAHETCEEHNDTATASLIEVRIDPSEQRNVVPR